MTTLEPELGELLNEPLGVGSSMRIGALDLVPGDPLPKREEVEPYLTALLQAEHLNLLVGSGLTIGATALVGLDPGAQMSATVATGDEPMDRAIEAAAVSGAVALSRGQPNIEDRLRVAISIADGLELVADDRAATLRTGINRALRELARSVATTEAGISAHADDGTPPLASLLVTFLSSFASRTPTRDRLHVFTTNYDRVIEWVAERAGLRIVDRFVGYLSPVFRSSRLEIDLHFTPPGSIGDPRHLDGVFRLTKLHGSLDWHWDGHNRRVFRRPREFGAEAESADGLLIYPVAAKDVETTYYPYAELFRDFSFSLCRPNTALVTYGYGFGDDHVNRVIADMLSIPSTHLLVLSFDDCGGRLEAFATQHGRLGQVSMLVGSDVAALDHLVNKWLPWPTAGSLLRQGAEITRERNRAGEVASPPAGIV